MIMYWPKNIVACSVQEPSLNDSHIGESTEA